MALNPSIRKSILLIIGACLVLMQLIKETELGLSVSFRWNSYKREFDISSQSYENKTKTTTGVLRLVQENSSSHLDSEESKTVFDPVNDIDLGDIRSFGDKTKEAIVYSSHRCVGSTINDMPDFVGRTCVFHDLYYSPKSKQFHYLASPLELSLFPDLATYMSTSNSYVAAKKFEEKQHKAFRFTPEISSTFPNTTNIASVHIIQNDKEPVFILYRPSYDFNIGHLLTDTVLSMFQMLSFFGYIYDGVQRHQVVPLIYTGNDPYFRCVQPSRNAAFQQRFERCQKMWKIFFPSFLGVTQNLLFTGSWLSDRQSEVDFVRLPTMITGPGKLAYYGCRGECLIHQPSVFNHFRAWLMRNILGPKRSTYLLKKEKETEVITESKTTSNTTKTNQTQLFLHRHHHHRSKKIVVSLPMGSTHKDIEWFNQSIPVLEKMFGKQNVTVVDLASLSMAEEVELLSSASVLLSNEGGGAYTSLFLPQGSSLLIFHRRGQNFAGSYDGPFFRTFGHIRKVFLPVGDSVDTIVKNVQLALS